MKKTIVFIITLLTTLFFTNPSYAATTLEQLANSLQPGTWAELKTAGFSGQFLETVATDGSPGTILVYADSATWDPTSKKFLFLGSPHYRPYKFIIYDDATNSWSAGPCITGIPCSTTLIGHGYDNNAFDPATGSHYYHLHYSSRVFKYHTPSGTWTELPRIPGPEGRYGAIAWYPELGGLIFVDIEGSYGVYLYKPSTNQWSQLTPAGFPIGPYSQFAEYNPVHKVVIFGGGYTRNVYKLDSSGNITQLRQVPIDLGVSRTLVTVDPVSGKYLIFTATSQMYEYDVTTDTWSAPVSLPFSLSYSGSNFANVVTPVSAYGVIMLLKYDWDQSKVYLYKHSSSTPPPSDTQVPSTPTNLSATTVSSSQINLSWIASTDNVGVTGYRIYRCQGTGCTPSTQIATVTTNSYSDAGLSASTVYVYRVAAYDAAGNVSGQSSSANATTQSDGGGTITGLDFPSNGSGTVQFRFTGANLNNSWPATYIWRVRPRQQTGYYTTFFWGHMSAGSMADFQYNYYGAHPYPVGGYTGTSHNWEISINGGDFITDQNGYNTTVVKDRWYTQALTAERIGNDVRVTFYWDLETGANRVIQTTRYGYALNFPPTNPGLVFGDAPWSPGNELLSGVLRGLQIYSTNLSLSDILTEAANQTNNSPQTTSGQANVWYMNQNPTPTDISDKSGKSHNPSWFNSNRPALYTAGGSSDTTPPTISITAPSLGSTVSGSSVAVSANASDNVGVLGVQFKLDGANLGSEDTTSPYSITWNTTQTTNGLHTLTATARDAAANQTTSAGVTVTVNNAVTDTSPPSIPANLSATAVSSSQINLSWTASTDNIGVTGYRIYRGGIQIATVTTNSYSNIGLSPSTNYSYTIVAYDAVGNVSVQSTSASATTQAAPPTGQINITPGIFYGLTGPNIGSGISSNSNKHTTWAHNPLDGRLYSIGGDFTSQYGYADSYEQEQYSLSIYERWTNQLNNNAGWRSEYPYCGPNGGIQPKSPDFTGWSWDSNRNVFWSFPGTFVIPVYASCSDRTVSTSDDPKYKYRHIMTFNPAESDLTKRWTDWGQDTTPWRGEPWMGFYDPITDTITKFAGDSTETADIFNVQTKTWSRVGYGPNAVGGTVRIPEQVSPDYESRVAYVIDGTAGRLMRWNMDSRTLSDLGTIPDGPVTPITNAYSVWDSVNKVLIFFHYNTGRLHVYHPTAGTWEIPSQTTNPAGLTPHVRHAMVFDPQQNVVAFLGNTSNDNRIYLYRYANAPAQLKGDVNSDSAVDVLDVQALVNHILGIQDYGSSADVNSDSSVDVLDVQEVVNVILGG